MNNVSMKLSEHFSLAEMCKTSANLDNVPNEAQVENLKRLCGWLEMLRSEWNKRYGEGNDPIFINSGFRSEAVNKAVGGVKGITLVAVLLISAWLASNSWCATPPFCSTSAMRVRRTLMSCCWSVRQRATTGSTSPSVPQEIAAKLG